jgi:hypothetical protein
MTKMSTRYSQEARVTVTSSTLPTGLMTDLSANSIMVWVGLNYLIWIFCIVSKGITLISSPKSMSVFGKEMPLISIVTTGFPRSLYLYVISEINSDNCQTT